MHIVVIVNSICTFSMDEPLSYCTNVFGCRDTAGQERFRSMTRCQYRGTKVRIYTTLAQKDYENISLVLADPILNDAQQTV